MAYKGRGIGDDVAAGVVGMSAKKTVKDEDNFDCFQPRVGRWMLEDTRTPLRKGV